MQTNEKGEQETFTYQVEVIETVEHDDVDALSQEVQGKRLTLGTCIPVGSDSNRLMVRAKQVVTIEYDFDALAKQLPTAFKKKIGGFVTSIRAEAGEDAAYRTANIAHQLRVLEDQLEGRKNTSADYNKRLQVVLEYLMTQIAISEERPEGELEVKQFVSDMMNRI